MGARARRQPKDSEASIVAAGNQAPDGKGQGAGYQLGDLDLGAMPKRAQSGELAAVNTNGAQAQARSGAVPVGPAGQEDPAAVQAAQARALAAAQAQQRAAMAQAQAAQAAQAQQRAATAQAQAAQQAAQPAQAPVQRAFAAPSQAQVAEARAPVTKEKGLARRTSLELAEGDGPALELDLDAVRGSKPGAAAAGAKPQAPAKAAVDFSSFGGKEMGDGFGDDHENAPKIELEEIDRSAANRVQVKGAPGSDSKAEAAKEAQLTDQLADYGDDPENLIESVKYAVRVVRRIIALKRDRKKAVHEVNGLEADYNTALVQMGQGLMAIATEPQMTPLRSKVAAVHDASAKVSHADATMSKTKEQNLQAMAALDREAAELRQNLQPYIEAEQAADRAQKRAEDEVKRGQALQRRVEIELRAVMDAKTAADPARMEDLKNQLDQRRAVVQQLTQALDAATQGLGQARRELAMRRGALDAVEDRKKRMIEEARAKEAEVEQHAKAAEGTHAAALRALAEAAREQKLEALVEDKHEWVKEVEGVLADARKVLARYDRALTLYDRDGMIKGCAVIGGTLLLLIAALVLGVR